MDFRLKIVLAKTRSLKVVKVQSYKGLQVFSVFLSEVEGSHAESI